MDNLETEYRQVNFLGSGSKFFGIYIVNLLLTAITLGLYYPWAKAATLKYLYQETELEGSRFAFHGTGKEMFKGFIKAVGIFAVLYGILLASMVSQNDFVNAIGFLVYFVGIFALLPIAIHGSLKYRMSRSSWRGIHFGYRGHLNELFLLCLKGGILSVITLGLYTPWFTIKLRQYLIGNIRFGNIEFRYNGDGTDYAVLILKGYILTFVTFGIYFFWFVKDLINYYIDHIELVQDGRVIKLQSYLTGGAYFRLAVVNVFIILLTLGLGAPWATVRTLKAIFGNMYLEGELDTNALVQTERYYNDATGDDVADMLDVGII